MRPRITKLIAASSSSMDAKEVVEITLNGIKLGKLTITCNIDGFMLSIATVGMSPQPSATMAFLEVIACREDAGKGWRRTLQKDPWEYKQKAAIQNVDYKAMNTATDIMNVLDDDVTETLKSLM
ncbi:hypothetical protein SUGI_0269960 [Cryptomeria japonica]|nr:hypothetical protein SUGI_0269960 [Cryptomeria japonica]